jgi:Family of unknown function (DUF6627)
MKQYIRSIGLLMAIIILIMSVPGKSAQGAMIGTEAILDAAPVWRARSRLKQSLTRQDVQERLAAWGISPLEAAVCIDNLTDAEIQLIVAKIEDLPSGGGFWGIVGIVMVAAFVIF